MMQSTFRFAFVPAVTLAALFCTAPAKAKDDGTDASVTVEKLICRYAVNADGTYELDGDEIVRINETRAIDSQSQHTLYYNRAFETLAILGAYTEKPDGRKIEVKPEQMREQQAAGASGAPMFQDVRTMNVVFPEVEVRDRLVLNYRYHVKTAAFPGRFHADITPGFSRYGQYAVIFDLPESTPFKADVQGFTAAPVETRDGHKIYRWDFQPGENARIEAGSVAYYDYGRHLRVSTFADYADVARAYADKTRDGSAITPAIQALADRLTAGIAEPRERALVLTDWVRKNIRYISVGIGANGYVPHDAGIVLANIYGDAKDVACLLEALLTAAGIDSTQVLINAGSSYRLPPVALPSPFGHIVNYLPALDLWLDATDPALAAGNLRQGLWDKPALLVKSGELRRTPAVQPTMNEHVTDIRIDAEGDADFSYAGTYGGWSAEPTRYRYRNMHPTALARLTENLLRGQGLEGEGTVDTGDLAGAGKDYVLKMKGHIRNLTYLPGPIGLPAVSNLSGGIAGWVSTATREPQRSQPYVCLSGETKEEARYEFPAGARIIGLPRPTAIHNADIDYTAEYVQEDAGKAGESNESGTHGVVVKRSLAFHHAGAVCMPNDYRAVKADLDRIMRDLASQIVVQQN